MKITCVNIKKFDITNEIYYHMIVCDVITEEKTVEEVAEKITYNKVSVRWEVEQTDSNILHNEDRLTEDEKMEVLNKLQKHVDIYMNGTETLQVKSETITDDVYELNGEACLKGEFLNENGDEDDVYFLIPESCGTDYTTIDYSEGLIQYSYLGMDHTISVNVEIIY